MTDLSPREPDEGSGLRQVALTVGGTAVEPRPGQDLPTAEMVLNIGPQHPATHGVLRLRLTLDGERIVAA